MKLNEDEYRAWLEAEGYRPSTIETTVRSARRILSLMDEMLPIPATRNYVTHVRRLRLYKSSGWSKDQRAAFEDLDARWERRQATPLAKKRDKQRAVERKARSYSDAEWRRLHRKLVAASDEDETVFQDRVCAIVLRVMMESGLRVGDVLSLTKARLAGGVRTGSLRLVQKGGSERILPVTNDSTWMDLHAVWQGAGYANVAMLVSPHGDGSPLAGHAAYQAVNRALKVWHTELDLDGRPHLHRLRRTVGVQTIRESGDIELARQMLGHASLSSTQTYVDEARTDDLEKLQGRLRKRFTEDTDDAG